MASHGEAGSVFVVAAAGFIGEGVARAFKRAGYTVYGLIRKEAQARLLKQFEIIPVIGDGRDPSTWREIAEKASVIIDCSSTANTEDDSPYAIPAAIINVIKQAPVDPIFPPKIFIYCSGIMVYGHDERIRDENWPTCNTVYATWRTGVERLVLKQQGTHITPIVIRPAWVFGQRMGNHGSSVFGTSPLTFAGVNKDRRYSWIHIDDLGDHFVAAAKQGARVKGEVFNAVGYDSPKWVDLVVAGHALAGHKGEIKWVEKSTDADELRDANVVLNPQKSIDLLGWVPKQRDFLGNLQVYYNAFKAYDA